MYLLVCGPKAVVFYIVVTSFRVSREVLSCELVSVLCSAFNINCDYYLSYLIMALYMLEIDILELQSR